MEDWKRLLNNFDLATQKVKESTGYIQQLQAISSVKTVLRQASEIWDEMIKVHFGLVAWEPNQKCYESNRTIITWVLCKVI